MRRLVFSLLLWITPAIAAAGNYEIQDLTALQDGQGAIVVQGVVRNMGKHPMQGTLILQFLKPGGEVQAVESSVNGGKPLWPGEVAPFEFTVFHGDPEGYTRVSVDFVETRD